MRDYTCEEQLKFTENHAVVNAHTPDYTCQEQLEFTENHGVDVDLLDSTIVATASSSSLSSNFNVIDTVQHDVIEKNDIADDVDDKCDIFGVKFETLIVGRRYADQEGVCVGETVCLLRDSQNVKDANAIKVFVVCLCFFMLFYMENFKELTVSFLLFQVVSADSGCSKFLGYLPRELAQYLSPLIDNYGIVFQVLLSLSHIMCPVWNIYLSYIISHSRLSITH